MRGNLMWTCLVWDERSTPDNFACQVTDSIPPQVSRKESLSPFIVTPSRPVGCRNLINAKRQAVKCKPPIFYVFSVTRSGIEPRPPAPRADSRGAGLGYAGAVEMSYGIWNVQ